MKRHPCFPRNVDARPEWSGHYARQFDLPGDGLSSAPRGWRTMEQRLENIGGGGKMALMRSDLMEITIVPVVDDAGLSAVL